MAEQFNVLQSLFGFTPENVQQGLFKQAEQRALDVARAGGGIAAPAVYYGLRSAERVAARPIFGENPQVARAGELQSIVQQVQASGADLSTPVGIIELANALQQNPQFSGMAVALRQQAATMQQQEEARMLKAEEVKATTEFKRAQAEQMTAKANMPMKEDISPQLRQYRELLEQGLSPAEARRIAYNIPQPKAGEEGPKVGFSKTGAFTNQFGETIPATEMSKNRTGFQSAERLLGQLNSITDQDVRNAEAKVDYTQSEARKAVGGTLFSKTLDAQTKIAASQLLQQIEALPPGSASDADMRTAAREFPGYSDATALRNWVNRTKATLEQSLSRQAEQFGFQRRITATAPIGQQQAAPAARGGAAAQPVATKRYNPATGQLEDIR